MLSLFPQDKYHKYDMNHYLVCGVHNYVMISCNAFRLNLKSLTLRKRLFYISVLFVYFVYLESVFCDPTESLA